jgi:hypothetical protein
VRGAERSSPVTATQADEPSTLVDGKHREQLLKRAVAKPATDDLPARTIDVIRALAMDAASCCRSGTPA